nr:hypothetical protein CFP56_17077 [Quercus suber]
MPRTRLKTSVKAAAMQQVLELSADLEKAKAIDRMVEEAAKALKQASYELGVQETEVRLANELAKVCKDYCKEVWLEALNLAGVPTTSEWREARNVYYLLDICEILANLPPSITLAPLSMEQPLTTQGTLPPLEVPKEPSQVGDQG